METTEDQKSAGSIVAICSTPYILKERIVEDRLYNRDYGDDRICQCGHPYHRHFDSYDNMEDIGCKYCGCHEFVEQNGIDEGRE